MLFRSYRQLLINQIGKLEVKQTQLLIRNDINCMNKSFIFFYDEFKKKLERIILNLTIVSQDIDYRKGLVPIAGVILNVIRNEEKSFWMLLKILDRYSLKSLFIIV